MRVRYRWRLRFVCVIFGSIAGALLAMSTRHFWSVVLFTWWICSTIGWTVGVIIGRSIERKERRSSRFQQVVSEEVIRQRVALEKARATGITGVQFITVDGKVYSVWEEPWRDE